MSAAPVATSISGRTRGIREIFIDGLPEGSAVGCFLVFRLFKREHGPKEDKIFGGSIAELRYYLRMFLMLLFPVVFLVL